jgi:polar amino acid transport system permease protein
VAAAALAVLIVMLVHSLFFSHVLRNGQHQERYQWGIIKQYFLSASVVKGLGLTVALTAIAMTGGVLLGMSFAVMRMSPNPILSGSAWVYIWFFRGTPVLVQLLFWYNASYLFPSFSLGVPFGPALVHFDLNTWITPFVAGCVGLSLNEGAYMAEIVRAGILSVDAGQTEAAQSVGMTRLQALWLVVLPQAMRVVVPPTGNETISMLKTSSLASVITVAEITFAVGQIYAANYEVIPLLMVAAIWYLVVTTVLTTGQYYVERYYARGSVRELPPTPWQRVRSGFSVRPGRRVLLGPWLGPEGKGPA